MVSSECTVPGSPQKRPASVYSLPSVPVMAIDADERAFELAIEKFDVRNATCFVEDDRQRLSAVLAAGFVNLDNFNRVISGTLMRSLAARRRSPLKRGLSKSSNFRFNVNGSPSQMRRDASPVARFNSEPVRHLRNGSLEELVGGKQLVDGVRSFTTTLDEGLHTTGSGGSPATDLPFLAEGPPPIETSFSSPPILMQISLGRARCAVITPLGHDNGAMIEPDSSHS